MKRNGFDILHFVADNAGLSTFEAIEKAYNMGVAEQEPILDKIRAEIADIYCGQYCENPYTAASIRKMALDIIDKYRTESEAQDADSD